MNDDATNPTVTPATEPPPPPLGVVLDHLVSLEAQRVGDAERIAMVGDLRRFFRARESNYALQQLFEDVQNAIRDSADMSKELERWRPLILRLVRAEAEKVEAEAQRRNAEAARLQTGSELQKGALAWAASVFDARLVVLIVIGVLAAFGIGLNVGGGAFSVSTTAVPQTTPSSDKTKGSPWDNE